MTKAEGFLTNPKKHLELQETSRTPTIVLSCLRVLIESSRMLDHARSLAARVQERNRFPTVIDWALVEIDDLERLGGEPNLIPPPDIGLYDPGHAIIPRNILDLDLNSDFTTTGSDLDGVEQYPFAGRVLQSTIPVLKRGCKTASTKGELTGIRSAVKFGGVVSSEWAVLTEGGTFSLRGDSGSWVYGTRNNALLGMIFMGRTKFPALTYITNAKLIFDSIEATTGARPELF
jgi:hypothetical protein